MSFSNSDAGRPGLLAEVSADALSCAVGLLANVGVAAVLVREGLSVYPAALAGIAIGSVWNYALSSRFVWGRFR